MTGSEDYFLAFFQGLLSALSACVYPLLPVITAMFARFGEESGSKHRIYILSFIYLSGMVLSYVGLGVLAALSGSIFGSWMSHPIVSGALGVALVLFGLSYLELIPFHFKGVSDSGAMKVRNKYAASLLLGIFSAFVAAPCAAPLFGSVLIEIARQSAEQSSIVPGVSMGASFSLGMGLPFMLAGVLSMKLPRSGNWLGMVKIIGGTILITAGIHYFEFFQPQNLSGGIGFMVILLAFYVLFIISAWKISLHPNKPRYAYKLSLLLAIISLFSSSYLFANLQSENQLQDETWSYEFKDYQKHELSMIDFWADWCAACKQMEKEYFSKPRFESLVQKYKLGLLKVDLSDYDNDDANAIADQYNVHGLPTLVLIDRKGKAQASILGYTGAQKLEEELLFHLKRIQGE